jgi:hypothetical protein
METFGLKIIALFQRDSIMAYFNTNASSKFDVTGKKTPSLLLKQSRY